VGPCVHCGRLTDHEESICSYCQQRKERKSVVSPELRSQKEKAIKMAEQYQKPFRVIKNQHGEILVFPAAVPVQQGTSVLYETEAEL
jgi:recombinational DNA repair protein RecR